MPKLYRGLFLGHFDPPAPHSPANQNPISVMRKRLDDRLQRHWTPDKHIATLFALGYRGHDAEWRKQVRERGPVLGLILIIDSETIDDGVLTEAARLGREAAEWARKTRGFDFFDEKEYRFSWGWCPDLDNLRAEVHQMEHVIPVSDEFIRAVVREKRDAGEDRIAEAQLRKDEERWARGDYAWELAQEQVEWERRYPGVGPGPGRPWSEKDRRDLAEAMAAETDWFYAGYLYDEDPDDARPDYWDSNDPESW